jgi:hypothetical protein
MSYCHHDISNTPSPLGYRITPAQQLCVMLASDTDKARLQLELSRLKFELYFKLINIAVCEKYSAAFRPSLKLLLCNARFHGTALSNPSVSTHVFQVMC